MVATKASAGTPIFSALGGQILHIAVFALDNSAYYFGALGDQLHNRRVEQHLGASCGDLFLQLCADGIRIHRDIEGGVPAAGKAQLVIGSGELWKITGVEGQKVVFHRDLQLRWEFFIYGKRGRRISAVQRELIRQIMAAVSTNGQA